MMKDINKINQEISDIKVIIKIQFEATEKYLEEKRRIEKLGKKFNGIKVEIDKGFEQRLTELYRRKAVYY